MASFTKEFSVRARDFVHAGEASVQIKTLLKSIGYDAALVRRISICSYEAEMNIVMHGADGRMILSVDDEEVVIEAEDAGPGIADLDLAFRVGYSTATPEHREMGFGAGMGLPNIRKNAGRLEVRSRCGSGTYLRMGFPTA
jgi:anti-sigma regulatory factor (Ser/Thr protein kinase)